MPHSPTDTEILDWMEQLGPYTRYEVATDEHVIYNGFDHERHELGRGKTLREAARQAMHEALAHGAPRAE